MAPTRPIAASGQWRKPAALALAVAAVGLPINQLGAYALLVFAVVFIFTGEIRARAAAWIGALAIVVVAVIGQWLVAPPRIEEGHNVFLPDAAVLQQGLPADVYRQMAREFDAVYPPAVRCKPGSAGCWQDKGRPERLYAFSADGIWHKSAASRSVTSLDFSDPIWLRLGFINNLKYNWSGAAPDVHRNDRDRRFWMGLKRWHLAIPWFEMVRLPAAFVGGQLCWRGEIMWEGADGHFTTTPGAGCRAIVPADAGHRVFGIAIKPDTLAMDLQPPWRVRMLQLMQTAIVLITVVGLIALLVRVRPRDTLRPFILFGLSLLVIAIIDASFIGGWRPMDGGDDGLFYTGVGRRILEDLLGGNITAALIGGEKVFYYGGPGLRYLRALEMIVFGDSNLGYLSLVLLMPMLILRLFQRFLPDRSAWAMTLIFVAVPVGEILGTCFVDYAKWAARGFADPATYILFVAALLVLLGPRNDGPRNAFAPAFFSALLFALATTVKPVIALAVAVMLGGAGLAALYGRQWRRLAGLCIGFVPVFNMALHNYVFGGAYVLFSTNATAPANTPMEPWAYIDAARELFALNFRGPHIDQAALQIVHWLSGPSQLAVTIPLHIAAVVITVHVLATKHRFDPWLRLIALAALVQHIPALFYGDAPRYYFLAWLLTALVCLVWAREIGLELLLRRYPRLAQSAGNRLASLKMSA